MENQNEELDRGNKGDEVHVTEDMVEKLLGHSFDESRAAADNKRSKISKEEYHTIRALCKRNLFYLCFTVLGNNRLSTNLHGHLCTHISDTEESRFHSYLLPRGHFKSTIVTIGHSIQLVLPYTEEDRQYDPFGHIPLPWPSSLGLDCRVLIGHETAESAARFLYAITSHFTGNPLLMSFFPDAIPSKRKHRINKWELELPRSDAARGNPEPTIDTLGVGAKSQGRHYNFIKLDDIFGDKARDSAAEAASTIQWFDNIQSFFSLFPKDHLDLIGTRYSTEDVYAHAFDVYGERMIQYARKVEEYNPQSQRLEPIFGEEFTTDDLNILRKNKKVFAAQYENDPYDGESGFSKEWKKIFYWQSTNIIVIPEDNDTLRFVNIRDLDIVFLIDPGVGKTGGLCVTGMDYNGNVYILVAIKLDMPTPEFTDLVFRQAQKWHPRTVAIESDLFASTFQFWWADIMPKKGIRFHVTPVHTKKAAKDIRIAGLTNYAEHGRLFLNEKQADLNKEWITWGKSKNIHILDALAYGPEVWRPGYKPGQRDLVESSVGEQDPDVDTESGYSKIHYGTNG